MSARLQPRRAQPCACVAARRRQSGQALTESSLLLATLLGGLAVGGIWLLKTHPEMMNALNIHVQGFYFLLSLPFP